MHPRRRQRELERKAVQLWTKRNSASGAFVKAKRNGDVFKGVKREN